MHIKNYLLCSSFCLMANVVHAACPGGYQCATINFGVCFTAQGASADCSDGGQSPIMIYYNGQWGGSFAGTIDFNTIPGSGVTSNIPWNVTLGTLDDPTTSPTGIAINSASATGQTANGYDVICTDNGVCGAGSGQIPYTVQYKACNGNTQYISPNGAAFSGASYPITAVSMAGATPACKPSLGGTPGAGAGQLIFSIVPASSGSYPGGSYTGTFCMTVCTESAACSVASCT